MTYQDPKTDPKFVRQSSSFRTMKAWQIVALLVFVVLVVIVGLSMV